MAHLLKSTNGGNSYRIDNFDIIMNYDNDELVNEIKTSSKIYIVSYIINDFEFIRKISNNNEIVIIINSLKYIGSTKFALDTKKKLQAISPNVTVHLFDNVHAKIILANSGKVFLNSKNIDKSNSFNFSFFVDDDDVYKFYEDIIIDYIKKGKANNINHIHSSTNNTNPTVTNNKISNNNNVFGNIQKSNYTGSAYQGYDEINFAKEVNWNQKLNNIKERKVTIVTFSISDMNYAKIILDKLISNNNNVTIIANSIAAKDLNVLKNTFNSIRTATFTNLHAKMILIDNNLSWLSSQNFGTSSWFENTLRIKNKDTYRNLMESLQNFVGTTLKL